MIDGCKRLRDSNVLVRGSERRREGSRMEEMKSKQRDDDCEGKQAKFRCVHCGFPADKLLVQYSAGNIRLMKCENCKAVVDEYIECEFMILLIDLILHKRKAYRHLIYNVQSHHGVAVEALLWKATFVFLVLDGLRVIISYDGNGCCEAHGSSLFSFWGCGKIFLEVCLGNFIFFYALFLLSRLFQNASTQVTRFKEIFLTVLASSYFKAFLITMVIWEFPSSALYIIEGFVVSSNIVALKVLLRSTIAGCVGICIIAHAAKLTVNHMLRKCVCHWM